MKTLTMPLSIKATLIAIGTIFLIALILAPLLRDFSLLSGYIAKSFDSSNGFFNKARVSLQDSAQGVDRYVESHLANIAKKAALKDIYANNTTQSIHYLLTQLQTLESAYKNAPFDFKQTYNEVLSLGNYHISEKINELLFEALQDALESATQTKSIKHKQSSMPNISLETLQESIITPLSEHYLYVLNRNYTTISQATYDTIYMVFASIIVAVVFGLPLGVLLAITKRGKILSSPTFNVILGSLVNIVRSFPFIILIVLLLPISGFLVGSIVGPTAAIVPLGIAAIPFVARLFEGAFDEVNNGLIEATMSMGASKINVIKMMIAEAMPGLINAIIITIIGLIGYSAMAGALGAGGLGDVAIRLGFQSFVGDILFSSVVVIIILVQWIQSIGDSIVERLRKHR